jgi:pimeloyl-ACP methyl ester carboxylesterase
MARRLAAPVVTVPSVGHSPASEAPEATAQALLAFWRGTAAG